MSLPAATPRSLVTGAAGFIGSHVAEALLARGHDVVGLDDLSGGARSHVPPGVHFVQGCVTNDDLVRSLFDRHRFDYVFHLAAYAAEGLSHFIRRFNYTNNVIGSVTLINEAVRAGTVKCFVFTSSIAVYGEAEPPVTEETPPAPIDPYGIAKLAVELDLQAARRTFGLRSVVFRPHNVYGERQNMGDRHRNVIAIFMRQILRGDAMTIFGDGRQTRAFTYVGDVAPIIAEAAARPDCYDRMFNLGSDEVTSVLDLAHRVAGAMGTAPRIEHLPPRHEAVHAYARHDTIARVFGDVARTTLDEGLRRMSAWARQQPIGSPAPFGALEVTQGLPATWRPGSGA